MSGSSSGVEHLLPKQMAEGSNPFSRSSAGCATEGAALRSKTGRGDRVRERLLLSHFLRLAGQDFVEARAASPTTQDARGGCRAAYLLSVAAPFLDTLCRRS